MSTPDRHTPEPWEARRDPCHFDSMSSIGAVGGNSIAEVGGESWRLQEANTARIVACVNALTGIASPSEFVARARAIEKAARVMPKLDEIEKRVMALIAERDAMRRCLQDIVNRCTPSLATTLASAVLTSSSPPAPAVDHVNAALCEAMDQTIVRSSPEVQRRCGFTGGQVPGVHGQPEFPETRPRDPIDADPQLGLAISDALRSMLPPKGSILDDGGVVRRVLGTLPVTADGFVPGIGSRMFYTHGGEVFEVGVLPERVDDCYSTSFAAEAASAAPLVEELRKGEGQ